MKPLKRHAVHKKHSVGQFKRNVGKTKAANMKTPMRGGWRM